MTDQPTTQHTGCLVVGGGPGGGVRGRQQAGGAGEITELE